MCDATILAMELQAGLRAWKSADASVDRRALAKAMRDNWDRRVGGSKFGGVWSVSKARTNLGHPASREALAIPRHAWSGANVTVEHAVPVAVLFDAFWKASNADEMGEVVEAYCVAFVSRHEEALLREAGLTSRMPKGWVWGDSPLARWKAVGIQVDSISRRH